MSSARESDDHGSAVVELLLWAGILSLVLTLAVVCSRVPLVVGQLNHVAKVAAEEAAANRTAADASRAGTAIAESNLERAGRHCRHLHVDVDLSEWRPGGVVAATVVCDLELSDLAVVDVPGTVRLTSTFFAAIDTHKAVS